MTTQDQAARILMLRETRGIGLIEARQIVEWEDLHDAIDKAQTMDDIKNILRQLVNKR